MLMIEIGLAVCVCWNTNGINISNYNVKSYCVVKERLI